MVLIRPPRGSVVQCLEVDVLRGHHVEKWMTLVAVKIWLDEIARDPSFPNEKSVILGDSDVNLDSHSFSHKPFRYPTKAPLILSFSIRALDVPAPPMPCALIICTNCLRTL